MLKSWKMSYRSRKLDVKGYQNSSNQCRFFNKIYAGSGHLFFLVELEILGFVVAAIVFFTVLVFAAMTAFRTSLVTGLVAAGFHKNRRVRQFVLAKMAAQCEAGRAEKYSKGQDDMEDFYCQEFKLWGKSNEK